VVEGEWGQPYTGGGDMGDMVRKREVEGRKEM
jgi:hypothetical protein